MSFWTERVLSHAIDAVCAGRGPHKHRSEVVPLASGRTLDLGVGSGLNLPFIDAERVEAWVGIDPSAALLRRAAERARGASVPVDLVEGVGERLPFGDAEFDSVVVTYTYCSVADPAAVLSEIARVLRPSGKVLFAEHGRAHGGGARAVQRRLEPAWRVVAGGCTLQRDFVRELVATGLFVPDWVRVREDAPRWMSTVTSGVATRVR